MNQNTFTGEESQSPPFNGWIKREIEDSEEEVEEEEDEMYFKQEPVEANVSGYSNLMNLTKEELVTRVLQLEEDVRYLQDIRNGFQNNIQEFSSTCIKFKNVVTDVVSAISAIKGNSENESTMLMSNRETTASLPTRESTTSLSTKEPTTNFATKEMPANHPNQQSVSHSTQLASGNLAMQQTNPNISIQQSTSHSSQLVTGNLPMQQPNPNISMQQPNSNMSVKDSTVNRVKLTTCVSTSTVSTPSVTTSNAGRAMSAQLGNESVNKTMNKSVTESMLDNGSLLRSKLSSNSITLTEIPMASHSKSNANKSQSPVIYPQQPSPNVHSQLSSSNVPAQHSSTAVHPQHPPAAVHPQSSSAATHPSQVTHPQYTTPLTNPQQSSSTIHQQNPLPVTRPQHPPPITRPPQPTRQQQPSVTRPQHSTSVSRPQHSSNVARQQIPTSVANMQNASVANPQHSMPNARIQQSQPLVRQQNPVAARQQQPSPVMIPSFPKLPAGLTISVSKTPPIQTDESQAPKNSGAVLIPRTLPPGNGSNSHRNTLAPSVNNSNTQRNIQAPSGNGNNNHRNAATSGNVNNSHRNTPPARMKQKNFNDDPTNFVPEKRMRNMSKPSVSFISKQLSIKIKSEPVDEDSSEEDVKVLMPEEWILALGNSSCKTVQSVSGVSKTSFFKEVSGGRVSQKMTRNVAIDTSANCSISEWTDQIMGHDESGMMQMQDQQQNANYDAFGQDSMSQPFLTEDFGEYDSDDLDHKVYLSDDVSLPRELMDACIKQGPTPSKLTRNLMQSLFPDVRELATSCVTSQASNSAKQSRPALPENKVNAIISLVQRTFPQCKKSAIIMAMNMKCKEARKLFTRSGQSNVEMDIDMDESFD